MSKALKASLIVDLLGNISAQSRQWSRDLGAFSHAGQRGLGGIGIAARGMGRDADIATKGMRRALAAVRGSVRTVSADMDRLALSASGVFGRLSRVYGLLAGGAAAYGLNRAFINPAAAMESYTIRLNSINHGDREKTEATKIWAVQNARDTTWGLAGVIQEYAASRSFGMSDAQSKRFITMLQDQGGYHGWSLSDAQGAALQLRQMYARQSIMAQDTNLLTGYGINAYQLLANKLGVDPGVIREKGEKGLLGPEAIHLLFQVMADQARGAQKTAMDSWEGMTARMGDVWQQFARDVMDKGPFDRLKGALKQLLDYADEAQTTGVQDSLATQVAGYLGRAFEYAQSAAMTFHRAMIRVRDALRDLRDAGYGKLMDGVAAGAKTAAKYLLILYLTTRTLRLARGIGIGALRLGAAPLRYALATGAFITSPFRRPTTAVPGVPQARSGRMMSFLSGTPAAIQPVLVTNWPATGLSGGAGADTLIGTGGGKTRRGRRKKGPGKGQVTTVAMAGKELARRAAPRGIFGRMASRMGGWFGRIPGVTRASALLSAAARKLGSGKLTSLVSKTSRLARVGGGAFGAALMATPVLLDNQASARDKTGAAGSAAGLVAGGALGSLAGPVGTVIGSTVGSYLGEYLGGWLADAYQKITGGDNGGGQATQKAAARVELVAPEGWRTHNIDIRDSDALSLDMNVYSGGSYGLYG